MNLDKSLFVVKMEDSVVRVYHRLCELPYGIIVKITIAEEELYKSDLMINKKDLYTPYFVKKIPDMKKLNDAINCTMLAILEELNKEVKPKKKPYSNTKAWKKLHDGENVGVGEEGIFWKEEYE